MKKNDVVKFKNETEEEKQARESGLVRMVVLWVDSPRAMIEDQVLGMNIYGTQVHNIEDLEVIESAPE